MSVQERDPDLITPGSGPRSPSRSLAKLESRVERHWLAVLAAGMAAFAWGLMTVGGYVRASQSGMGCPDWPICKGQLVVGGHHALIEEIHRWIVTVLSVGLITIALLVFRRLRGERGVTGPTIFMLAMLALQVALGGITVILKNVSWTVVMHYGGASLLVVSITLVAARLRYPGVDGTRDGFRRLTHWFVGLSFGLLLAGSTLANAGSNAVCGTSYPLCRGTLLPALDHNVVIMMVHRTWAGAMLVLAVIVMVRSRRDRSEQPIIGHLAALIVALYVVQAFLGFVIVGMTDTTTTEVIHSSFGSLTWLALAALLALTRTLPATGAPSASDPRWSDRVPLRLSTAVTSVNEADGEASSAT
jgi:heme A synthase